MKILLTGSNGFVGNNIKPILEQTYTIKTLGRSQNCDYQSDISKEIPIINDNFDIIVHCAGKAHIVPKTKEEIQSFYDVNYKGTQNLCYAFDKIEKPKYFVFISTVAVYGCEEGENITENYPLNGNTPYAISKIKAEEFLKNWCQKHNVILTILRPSLIAGKKAPGNLGAMVKGIKSGRYLSIDKSKARKSVVMVEDIANIIKLSYNKGGIFNVCDSTNPNFRDLETVICKQLNKKLPTSIPLWIAKIIAFIGNFLGKKAPINTNKLKKIVNSLTFSNKKAITELNWKPINVIDNYKIY